MSTITFNGTRDPKFPSYVYASQPLVRVYNSRHPSSKKGIANLFMGEWMKILDDKIPEQGRVHVRYRGGEGYVDSSHFSGDRFLELFFIDVSQGDSILIQMPEDRRILIDGGQGNEAHDFIRNKYRLDKPDNFIDFDAIVATHSDADHTQGLIPILEDPKIAVKRFYHNGLFRRKNESEDPGPKVGDRIYELVDRPKLTDPPELASLMKKIVKAVEKAKQNLPKVIDEMKKLERWKGRIDLPNEGFVFNRLDAADGYLPPYNDPAKLMKIRVLWPAARREKGKISYGYYGSVGTTVNGNSIVLLLEYGERRILLTGDLNTESMDDILKFYRQSGQQPENVLRADVYKAAHHGSQHFSLPFLKTVRPSAAVISSGDDRNDVHGHPRAVLMGTITRYSEHEKPAVFSTELAACYSPLPPEEQKQFKAGNVQLYERSIQGIIHLRCDGNRLYLGTVFGRKPPEDPRANILWKWDIWPEED